MNPGDLDDDPFATRTEQRHDRNVGRRSSSPMGLLITFCVGVGVTVAWYSFGGPVREAIAGMSPQLAWMAPQPAPAAQAVADPATPTAPSIDQQLSAASLDIDAVRLNVDHEAALAPVREGYS